MQSLLPVMAVMIFALRGIAATGAQATGREIKGTVRDAKTSEAVIGAAVIVRGTQTGAVSDAEGRFTLRIPEGPCTIDIRYISYKEASVEIPAGATGATGPLDIRLESEDVSIREVVVTGRKRADTENAMIATTRLANQVVSGIAAAQIAKSPDRNASEVVRRIPGITVIDDRFIIVRGLSQRYNNAWINGLAVPSTETDTRAFSFDLIPSSQIDNMLVYKSPSPEIPGDFSGGFVKITTKGVPDHNRMDFGYTTGFNTRTQFNDFRINPGSGTDFLGFDLNKRPLGNAFPAHMDAVTSPDEITRLTRHGLNNDWRVKSITPIPDQRLSFSIARRMETRRARTVGNITAINYSNTFKGVEGIKNARYGIYSAAADKPIYLDDYFDNQYSNDVRLGAMHNWSFILNPSNRIEFKNLFNLLGRNRLTERTGIKDMSSPYYIEQTEMLYSSRLTYSGQLSGEHEMRTSRQRIDWSAGYSYADKNEPDRRIVTNMAGISDPADIPDAVTSNDNIKRYYQRLHDHSVSASANYRKTFGHGGVQPVLKAGLYAEYRNRDYTPREFIYRYDKLSYEERRDYLKLPFAQMLREEYLGAEKVYIDEITNKTNAYSANVYHAALYAAVEIPLGRLNIYAGARLESNTVEMTRDRADSPSVTLITTKTHDELNLLPSANLTYKFSEKHQLRAAYGRSLNRPELRELSPTVYYDFDLFSEIAGNENLKTAHIDNADLRYEFYPAIGEMVSVGLFYKHFRNPIEWTYVDMGGSLRYNYENAASAENWGVEVEIRKNLAFMGLRNVSLMLNAALIESNVRFRPGEVVSEPDRSMQGQSPYVVNAGIYYQSERLGLSMALLYNRIGRRIVGLGKSNSIDPNINTLIPDSYEMPRNVLDLTVAKTVGKRVEIRCSVKDILSEEVVYKQFPKFEQDGSIRKRQQVTRRYNPGQSISLGVSVKIN